MKHLIIGTAGHVDHGKTALVRALSGIDCDTHKEEKERGITINLGFSFLELPDGDTLGIVDVPGHKDFIRTMVAGAHGIDIAMPVIAADSGIMPQTIEHLRIIEMLGIRHGIIVITKSDLVDEETLELARLEAMDFVEGTPLEDAEVVAVSSVNGQGIEELRAVIENLVKEIKQDEEPAGIFRLFIDRVFNVKGIGYVVTGTVINGKINAGEELFLLPGKGKKVRVKGLQRYTKTVESVSKGDRAAINLADFKQEEYEKGMALCGKMIGETRMIDAFIRLFDHKVELGVWSNAVFYSGTFECMARIHLLDKDLLAAGDTAIVQIHLNEPAILINNDKFILRNTSGDVTLGGGTVIDTDPLHHRRRTVKLVKDLTALMDATLYRKGTYDLALLRLIRENKPMPAQDIARILDVPLTDFLEEIRDTNRDDIVLLPLEAQTIMMEKTLKEKLEKDILAALKGWHERYPLYSWGMDEKEIAGKLNIPSVEGLMRVLFDGLEEKGLIRKSGNTRILKDHAVMIDERTREQLDWLEKSIRDYGREKPVIKEIEQKARERKISGERLKMMMVYLSSRQKIYFRSDDLIHYDIVDECRTILLKDLINKEKGINEKEFRELINGTKKIVQLLLAIYLEEEIIRKETFFIHITELGRKKLDGSK